MASTTSVDLEATSNVDKFRKQVKAENADDLLKDISPARLTVYANRTSYESKEAALAPNKTLENIGHYENPLVVVVPNQTQGIGMGG